MSRLVDISPYEKCRIVLHPEDSGFPASELPTVDAVEVVRCENCKYWTPISEYIEHMECDVFCGCYGRGYPTSADDFCSYGERKEVSE